jgi:hypothetical protein
MNFQGYMPAAVNVLYLCGYSPKIEETEAIQETIVTYFAVMGLQTEKRHDCQ